MFSIEYTLRNADLSFWFIEEKTTAPGVEVTCLKLKSYYWKIVDYNL